MASASSASDSSDFDYKSFAKASKEKGAIEFINAFLELQRKKNPANANVLLAMLRAHLEQSSTYVKSYVGTSLSDVETFVRDRNYIWRLDEDDLVPGYLVVSRVTKNHRAMLKLLLDYIEYRSRKDATSLGARLKDVSSYSGEKDASFRRELGRGFEAMRAFLDEYPSLFKLYKATADAKLEDTWVLNRASVSNNVIVLNRGPMDAGRFEGVGRIMFYVPAQYYGFIRDDRSMEEAYFSLSNVEPPSINTQIIQRLKLNNQRFKFAANISDEHLSGNARNKYRVITMTPIDDEWKSLINAESTATAAGDRAKSAAASSAMAKKSVGQSSSSSSAAAAAASSSSKLLDTSAGSLSIENDFRPAIAEKPTTEAATGFTPDVTFEEFQILLRQLRNKKATSQEPSVVGEASSSAKAVEQSPPKSKLSAASSSLASPVPKPIASISVIDKPKVKKSDIAGPSTSTASFKATAPKPPTPNKTSTIPKSEPPAAPSEIPSVKPKKEELYQKLQREFQKLLLGGGEVREAPSSKKKAIEKKHAETQTEFNDEKEILMRILRKSPDLLKLVQILRPTE